MLHLIPAPLHRVLYRVAHAARRQWWRIRRPHRRSVVVAAFDEHDRVLLVRHSYGPPAWSLPGGGMDRGEQPDEAARREIREELRCGLTDLAVIDVTEQRVAGSLELQHLFAARLAGEPTPDMREIVAVTLADPDHLPEPCHGWTRRKVAQAVAARAGSQQR